MKPKNFIFDFVLQIFIVLKFGFSEKEIYLIHFQIHQIDESSLWYRIDNFIINKQEFIHDHCSSTPYNFILYIKSWNINFLRN